MQTTADYYVYVHKRKSDGSVFYVGKGKGKRAWDTDRNDMWKKIAAKHGVVVEIIRGGLTEDAALAAEKELIAQHDFKRLANMTMGGEGSSGYEHSEESKAKIGAKSKGNKHLLGKKFSDEAKRKMSEANKARWADPARRAAMSEKMKGRLVSKEHRAKLSAANKGKPPSLACRQAVAEANKRRAQ